MRLHTDYYSGPIVSLFRALTVALMASALAVVVPAAHASGALGVDENPEETQSNDSYSSGSNVTAADDEFEAEAFTIKGAPSKCFSTLEPGDLVGKAELPGGRIAKLRCGNGARGVIHIDDDHDIAANGDDDKNLRTCLRKVLQVGLEVPASAGNRAYQYRSTGLTATVVLIEANLDVRTMFTSGSGGNNWAKCADIPV